MKAIINTPEQRDTANFALQVLVAVAIIAALFVCIWQVALGNLKADSAVVGAVFTMMVVLVNFCFPNSIGSLKQADTISTLASAASAPITSTTTIEKGPTDGQDASGTPVAGSEGADSGSVGVDRGATGAADTALGAPAHADPDDVAPTAASPR
jgi:hypothetical protein